MVMVMGWRGGEEGMVLVEMWYKKERKYKN